MPQSTPTSKLKTFGDRLIDAVTEAGGPTQQEPLSKWFRDVHGINVSGPMLNKYKKHDKLPRMEQARDYAVALGVSVEWLYSGRGTRFPMQGPTSESERRLLGMWRRLSPKLKWMAFSYMQRLRLTPDLSVMEVSTEADLEKMILQIPEKNGFSEGPHQVHDTTESYTVTKRGDKK